MNKEIINFKKEVTNYHVKYLEGVSGFDTMRLKERLEGSIADNIALRDLCLLTPLEVSTDALLEDAPKFIDFGN